MSAAPGLGNANLRLLDPETDPADLPNIQVVMDPDPADEPTVDEKGNVVEIKHGDGSVTVSLDGNPIDTAAKAANDEPGQWFDNLADKIDETELNRIAEDLLTAVEEDKTSRQDWIEDRAKGLKLLGLKLEVPGTADAGEGAPFEGMSKVRHPLLLEACLRFQATSRSELLPTDGPVKIRNDDNKTDLQKDELANALERDMNHYFTAVATEYYPDTDRMLLMLGFGGTTFKKIYYCPMRNRPVSESVDADDIIVNQSAINLANARRVTHRTYLKPSTVKRLQILGVYRDISLSEPTQGQKDAVQEEEKAQQGVTDRMSFKPHERDREIYEICCELDIAGFGHEVKGKPSGLEIPYLVTIDVSDRKVLAVTRNYDEDTKDLPEARQRYVKYTYVPGLGFYDIGLLQILGNTTMAVTAAWREMLDNGMFANFPGFLIAKSGARQVTNVFRVPPGGGAQVDTQGAPINASVMPLPYETAHMAPLMELVANMVDTGQRVGGTSEMQVGEGKMEAPVGTTLALIDQATKLMNSVHKRLHAAQAEEFQLVVRCFREHPESFIRKKNRSKMAWDVPTFMKAINDYELVPQADPNTASMGQRAMKIQALMSLQAAAPNLLDPIAIITAALQAIGWANPEQFLVPPAARAAPPPQLQQLQEQMENERKAADAKVTEADARTKEAEAKAADTQARVQGVGHYAPKTEAQPTPEQPEGVSPLEVEQARTQRMDAETRRRQADIKAHEIGIENVNRDKDRTAKENETAIDLAKAVIGAPTAGESGRQVSVSGVGKKAVDIIGQVERGMKKDE